ncbi:lipoprotein [Spiroplasma eriocheiris]|uniref:lipoprotein n=1 Tax=Spiroplasma eriocheiris TaxID=315358 RepID=UPI0009A51FE2|nr:lipoprotein [Spiroplasma eriocheiris]AHF57712.1 hypothetical protein SPE_0584 [Spiroplasma eriocheiris CCTCC M 207170]
MKKLLAILGAIGLTATGASSVVACNKEDKKEDVKNLSSYSEAHKKEIALAVTNAIAKTSNKAAGENTAAYKAINSAVIDTLKSISKVSKLTGPKLQVNVLDKNNAEFTTHNSEFKKGDQLIIVVKALSGSELKGSLKVNLTVTDQVVVDLTKVTITVPAQTIPGDKSVAGDVTALQIAITNAVKGTSALSGLTIDTDYTIEGLNQIVVGKTPVELSAMKFSVKAKSTKIIGETPKFSVNVTKAAVAVDLTKVTITVPTQTIPGDKSVAGDVTALQIAITNAVKGTSALSGLTIDTDYTIEGLNQIVVGKTPVELSSFEFSVKAKSVKATGETPKFKVNVTKK